MLNYESPIPFGEAGLVMYPLKPERVVNENMSVTNFLGDEDALVAAPPLVGLGERDSKELFLFRLSSIV